MNLSYVFVPQVPNILLDEISLKRCMWHYCILCHTKLACVWHWVLFPYFFSFQIVPYKVGSNKFNFIRPFNPFFYYLDVNNNNLCVFKKKNNKWKKFMQKVAVHVGWLFYCWLICLQLSWIIFNDIIKTWFYSRWHCMQSRVNEEWCQGVATFGWWRAQGIYGPGE